MAMRGLVAFRRIVKALMWPAWGIFLAAAAVAGECGWRGAVVTGFEVDVTVLRDCAVRWDRRAQQVSELRPRLQAAELGRDSFGYIPGIGARVHEAYTSVLDTCRACLTAASDGTAEVGDGLRTAAETYHGVDTGAHQQFAALHEAVASATSVVRGGGR
jgi:hypothetical protein